MKDTPIDLTLINRTPPVRPPPPITPRSIFPLKPIYPAREYDILLPNMSAPINFGSLLDQLDQLDEDDLKALADVYRDVDDWQHRLLWHRRTGY